uniref:RNA-guided endonuclease InsQ/TnpB family protein n=1 Tax=Catenibacterium mitsuokai TaxID=100886 RepID=UPI0022E6830A
GYIPTTKDGYVIKSGHVSIKADRYYVSVLIEIPDKRIASHSSEGIGIDLGLKDFAIVSNGKAYKNINKSAKLKKLEKRLIREQRSLSRKYENLKKGGSTQKKNINRHLSKAVASQKFYEFKTKLEAKCREYGIELRIVDRWFPSSKTCHCCKHIKKDLKLSDRVFRCDCGYIEDRDFNAALNLRDATTYEVA